MYKKSIAYTQVSIIDILFLCILIKLTLVYFFRKMILNNFTNSNSYVLNKVLINRFYCRVLLLGFAMNNSLFIKKL